MFAHSCGLAILHLCREQLVEPSPPFPTVLESPVSDSGPLTAKHRGGAQNRHSLVSEHLLPLPRGTLHKRAWEPPVKRDKPCPQGAHCQNQKQTLSNEQTTTSLNYLQLFF